MGVPLDKLEKENPYGAQGRRAKVLPWTDRRRSGTGLADFPPYPAAAMVPCATLASRATTSQTLAPGKRVTIVGSQMLIPCPAKQTEKNFSCMAVYSG
jgi:hypothetical protein